MPKTFISADHVHFKVDGNDDVDSVSLSQVMSQLIARVAELEAALANPEPEGASEE